MLNAVDCFPLDVQIFTAHVAIGRQGLVNGLDQVQHLDDAVGPEVEFLADDLLDLFCRDVFGAKGVNGDRGGLGHTDGVGNLDFKAVRQAGRHDVLGHVAAA